MEQKFTTLQEMTAKATAVAILEDTMSIAGLINPKHLQWVAKQNGLCLGLVEDYKQVHKLLWRGEQWN